MTVIALSGCEPAGPHPYAPLSATAGPDAAPLQQVAAAQLTELQRRSSSLDVNNTDLHTQIAQSQRHCLTLLQQTADLRRQLSEADERLRQAQAEAEQAREARREAETRLANAQTTMRPVSVTIVPNNSLVGRLPLVDVAGAEVTRDGDLLRIAFPASTLFLPQSSQLTASAFPLFDSAAAAISQHFPRQIIVVEGHVSADPLTAGTATSLQALSATQAAAVCDQLLARRIPPNQLRVMGQGAAQPRVPHALAEGREKNARIELVVYPESF